MGLVLNCRLLSRAGDARGIINRYAPYAWWSEVRRDLCRRAGDSTLFCFAGAGCLRTRDDIVVRRHSLRVGRTI